MSNNHVSSKRIVTNTLLLYFRMLFLLVVSLYTSRVILNALGVDDYGIYNVVGGVVTMFTVISGSLSAAISRFITYELGTENIGRLKRVFSTSVIIQLLIALVIIILAETIGIWFLNNKMVIPEDRFIAANWVYQFSIVTFVTNLISVPYNAAIIAHEKMSAFAYISIFEGIGKLIVAWTIVFSPIDKLIFYALLLTLLAVVVRLFYGWYCKRHFEETSFQWQLDKSLLKEMFGFAGWNFIGSAAGVLRDQGGNIIINLFCGPAVNAARGIAVQVSAAINGFVQNFMTALNPQITKSYACGNRDYMMDLIFRGARFSYYMLMILSLPVLINTPFILEAWLKIVPEHTVHFVQLILIFSMHESLAAPLITAMLATGSIKKYQIIAGGINLLNLPTCYVFLKLGTSPESVFIIAIFYSFVVQAARLLLLRSMIQLDVAGYLKRVYVNVLVVTLLASVVPIIIHIYLPSNWLGFLISLLTTLIWTALVILFVGCRIDERAFIFQKIHVFYLRFKSIL